MSFYVGRIGDSGNIALRVSVTSETGDLLAGQDARPPSTKGWGTLQRVLFRATSMSTTVTFLDKSVDTLAVDIALDKVDVALFKESVTIYVSQVAACWTSVPNTQYQVQFLADLKNGAWMNLGALVPGNGNTQCVYDTVTADQPQRFYRVITVP